MESRRGSVCRASGFPSRAFPVGTGLCPGGCSSACTPTAPTLRARALDLCEPLTSARLMRARRTSTRRSACFRAAEILLLHAAERRNVEAYGLLAWIYEHDACEGVYWAGELESRAAHGRALVPAQRALEWRMKAAARGHAPSCCALRGASRASTPPPRAASRVSSVPSRLRWGGFGIAELLGGRFRRAMLGLARCSELGIGCAQSFHDALKGIGSPIVCSPPRSMRARGRSSAPSARRAAASLAWLRRSTAAIDAVVSAPGCGIMGIR